MRTILFITAVIVSLSSCTKSPTFEVDLTGAPLLDTVKVDVFDFFFFDTVSLTCEQTLIVEADYYWELLGEVDTNNISYLWSTGDTTPTITISNVPDQSIMEVGVTVSAMVTSRVWVNDSTFRDSTYYHSAEGDIEVRGRYAPLYIIASAFSPNNDGVNDFFNVTALCFTKSRLKVFDTFSRTLLFESTDINVGWDGTYKGKKMPADEYIYHFEITSVDNRTEEIEGYFQLVR